MSDVLLPLLVAVPILAAVVPLAAGLKRHGSGWPVAAVTTTALLPLAALLARAVYTDGPIRHTLGGFERPVGIELVADELSVLVVLLVALVALGTLTYARIAGPEGDAFYSGYLMLTGGLMGVALTGDLFNMFVFLEIVGLTTYALIASNYSGASAYAALKYLIVGTVGASLYLIGVGYVFVATGTLNMIDLQSSIAAVGYTDTLVQAGYAFIVAGFFVKIAIFPVHSWQPDAYQRAPDSVTMYISALVSTAAAYALIRVTYTVFTVDFLAANDLLTSAVLGVAGVSIVAGSALAAIQSDLKRMFAYSSVAQFGMIAAAVGLANETALLGGIVHLVGHGLLKFGLFLSVGLFAMGYGIRTVEDLASVARRAPFTAGAFVVLALALVGVPPSIGFVGKWYIAVGAVEAGSWSIAAIIFVSTLLTLAYSARIIEKLYFAGVGLNRSLDDHADDHGDHGGHGTGAVAVDGGQAANDDDRTADPSDEPIAPLDDAPTTSGIPDRVPTAAFAVLVVTTLVAVGLGFAGVLFFDVLEPLFGRFFA